MLTCTSLSGFGAAYSTANPRFYVGTYTGTGASKSITGFGFNASAGCGVLIIPRSTTGIRCWADTTQGAGKYKDLDIATAVQVTDAQSIVSFDSDGITLGTAAAINTNTTTYVIYAWKQEAGFFLPMGWTGNGAATRNISHSNGVLFDYMFVERLDAAANSAILAPGVGTGYQDNTMRLDSNGGIGASAIWANTLATSSQFTVNNGTQVNVNTGVYQAAMFTSLAGYQKIGTYTGNGSTSGPTVDTTVPFNWLLIKSLGTGNHIIMDTTRGLDTQSFIDTSAAETTADYVDQSGTSFTIKSASSLVNSTGVTYMFWAIKAG